MWRAGGVAFREAGRRSWRCPALLRRSARALRSRGPSMPASSLTGIFPRKRQATLIRKRFGRREPRQQLAGQGLPRRPAQDVVEPLRVRPPQIEPRSHDAAPCAVDEGDRATADRLDDADVGEPGSIRIAEEYEIARPGPPPPRALCPGQPVPGGAAGLTGA